jgi:putative DNA primase/helicase
MASDRIQQAFDKDMNAHNRATNRDLQGGDAFPLVRIICASTIEPEAINWLWDGYLARGKFHILAGQAGTGKTTLALNLAATVSSGGRFADGTKCEPAQVLIWSGEDDPSDTLIPRLIASGANLDNIHIISEVTQNDEVRGFDPANDVQSLIIATGQLNNIALLIVDPIVNAVAGDSHKNGEVRRALAPLVDFGQRMNCAILGISHFSKGTSGREPLERVTGSLAFGALARVVLATAKITEADSSRRIFCRAKSNIGLDGGGFEYDILQTELKDHAGIFASYAAFGDAIEGSARELLAEPDCEGGGNDCVVFLSELLAAGRMTAKEVLIEARNSGYSEKQIRTAREKLNIKPHRQGFGKGSIVYWDLPLIDAIDAHTCPQNLTASMGKYDENGIYDDVDEVDESARL